MSTQFVLVRHATCALMDSLLFGRAIDSPLDAQGELQAQLLAERLARYPDLYIEASPRKRTQQTATAIASRMRSSVNIATELDEVDFGRWAGLSFAELWVDPDWREWNERRGAARTPAGERMSDVQTRVVGRMRRLSEAHRDRTVALVTHAEVIRAVVLHCLAAPFDSYARLDISPASVTSVSVEGDHMTLHSVNERISGDGAAGYRDRRSGFSPTCHDPCSDDVGLKPRLQSLLAADCGPQTADDRSRTLESPR